MIRVKAQGENEERTAKMHRLARDADDWQEWQLKLVDIYLVHEALWRLSFIGITFECLQCIDGDELRATLSNNVNKNSSARLDGDEAIDKAKGDEEEEEEEEKEGEETRIELKAKARARKEATKS